MKTSTIFLSLPFILCLFLARGSHSLFAQPQLQLRFHNFNHIPNIPKQEIYGITKDRMGFIWIGSTDGLYKLDATNNIQIFKKNIPIVENGLASNSIRSLLSDSQDNIWIGTIAGGLTKYHQSTDTWKTYQYQSNAPTSISNNDILSIIEDHAGRIWVGTEYGLNLYQPETDNFISFLPNEQDTTSISARAITSILEDDQQRIWFTTWGGGVNLLLPNKGNITQSTFRTFYPGENLSLIHI